MCFMIRILLEVIITPFVAIWSVFDDDAHSIVSKRGREVLSSNRTIRIINERKQCKVMKTILIIIINILTFGFIYWLFKISKEPTNNIHEKFNHIEE